MDANQKYLIVITKCSINTYWYNGLVGERIYAYKTSNGWRANKSCLSERQQLLAPRIYEETIGSITASDLMVLIPAEAAEKDISECVKDLKTQLNGNGTVQ